MGVPAFFAWLLKKYKNSNFVFKKEQNQDISIDWFLIDTNCLCHPVCFKILHEEEEKSNINFKSLQNKMFNAIVDEIEKLIKFANPKIGVYIAIDGRMCKLCRKVS
jgi:5'-3' exonuclease